MSDRGVRLPGRPVTAPTFEVRIVSWAELGAALSEVRLQVFVREQGVPAELEIDALEADCEHVVAFDATDTPIGTGRLTPDGRIGRMAVLPEARGRGVGAAMLELLVARAVELGHEQLHLHAREEAVGFYARAGFRSVGEAHLEVGVPHQAMTLRCSDTLDTENF